MRGYRLLNRMSTRFAGGDTGVRIPARNAARMTSKRAFSLVELAIVLVILGLVTGGILMGQNLIRSAELKTISTDFAKFKQAVGVFQDTYLALPGDLPNATTMWGDNATHCADGAITDGTPGTCNGDGDGVLDVAAAVSQEAETLMFWNHLKYADLIEGNFSGVAGSGGTNHAVLDSNAPLAQINDTGWSVAFLATNYAGDASTYFAGNYGNYIMYGGQTTNGPTISPVLSPEEAWNIDTKLDDGIPGQGKVLAIGWDNCSNATSQTDTVNSATNVYDLDSSSTSCALGFIQAF